MLLPQATYSFLFEVSNACRDMTVSQNCVWNVQRRSGRMERRCFVTSLVPDLWSVTTYRKYRNKQITTLSKNNKFNLLYIYVCIFIYIYIIHGHIHVKDMHVEGTHASCLPFSLLICAASLLYTCSRQVCIGWLVLVL